MSFFGSFEQKKKIRNVQQRDDLKRTSLFFFVSKQNNSWLLWQSRDDLVTISFFSTLLDKGSFKDNQNVKFSLKRVLLNFIPVSELLSLPKWQQFGSWEKKKCSVDSLFWPKGSSFISLLKTKAGKKKRVLILFCQNKGQKCWTCQISFSANCLCWKQKLKKKVLIASLLSKELSKVLSFQSLLKTKTREKKSFGSLLCQKNGQTAFCWKQRVRKKKTKGFESRNKWPWNNIEQQDLSDPMSLAGAKEYFKKAESNLWMSNRCFAGQETKKKSNNSLLFSCKKLECKLLNQAKLKTVLKRFGTNNYISLHLFLWGTRKSTWLRLKMFPHSCFFF